MSKRERVATFFVVPIGFGSFFGSDFGPFFGATFGPERDNLRGHFLRRAHNRAIPGENQNLAALDADGAPALLLRGFGIVQYVHAHVGGTAICLTSITNSH